LAHFALVTWDGGGNVTVALGIGERTKAAAGDWGGQTFYFCSRGCKAEFMVDPETFVAPLSPTRTHLEVHQA
jgi:YHS domain-containing protein